MYISVRHPVASMYVPFPPSPESASSAAVDTAYAEPYEDPPRAEEGDDTVEEVVRTVALHIHMMHL